MSAQHHTQKFESNIQPQFFIFIRWILKDYLLSEYTNSVTTSTFFISYLSPFLSLSCVRITYMHVLISQSSFVLSQFSFRRKPCVHDGSLHGISPGQCSKAIDIFSLSSYIYVHLRQRDLFSAQRKRVDENDFSGTRPPGDQYLRSTCRDAEWMDGWQTTQVDQSTLINRNVEKNSKYTQNT